MFPCMDPYAFLTKMFHYFLVMNKNKSGVLNYVPRVTSCPMCLTCSRALRVCVLLCLCVFLCVLACFVPHVPYVPSFLYVPYVSSFFTCLMYPHFLQALRALIFYVPKVSSLFLRALRTLMKLTQINENLS